MTKLLAGFVVVVIAVFCAAQLFAHEDARSSAHGVYVNPQNGQTISVPEHCVTLPGAHKTYCGQAAVSWCEGFAPSYRVMIATNALGKQAVMEDVAVLQKMCLGVGVDLRG